MVNIFFLGPYLSSRTIILYQILSRTAWWSHRYNARTKSEGAVVRSPSQPKINTFAKGYYATHLIHVIIIVVELDQYKNKTSPLIPPDFLTCPPWWDGAWTYAGRSRQCRVGGTAQTASWWDPTTLLSTTLTGTLFYSKTRRRKKYVHFMRHFDALRLWQKVA